MYIYVGVSVYWPLSVLVCVLSNQSTSKKPQYVYWSMCKGIGGWTKFEKKEVVGNIGGEGGLHKIGSDYAILFLKLSFRCT